MVFESTLDSTLPFKVYQFGDYDNVDSSKTDTVTFTEDQEVMGILALPNGVNFFEGIMFYLSDRSIVRIGRDQDASAITPANFFMLNARFIGMEMKWFWQMTDDGEKFIDRFGYLGAL